MATPWIAEAASILLSAVFVLAALGKLSTWSTWRRSLTGWPMPAQWIGTVAAAVPAAELALAMSLLVPDVRREAAVFALAVLVMFTAAVMVRAMRTTNVTCNCFGRFSRATPLWLLAFRNSALAILAGILVAVK